MIYVLDFGGRKTFFFTFRPQIVPLTSKCYAVSYQAHFAPSFGNSRINGLFDHVNQMFEMGTCHH